VIDAGEKPIIFISPRAMKKFAEDSAKAAGAYTRHLI
jgi:hypothetical protein